MIDPYTLNEVSRAIYGLDSGLKLLDAGTRQQRQSILNGGYLEYQGYMQQAQGYNQAAVATGQIGAFNQAIQANNTAQQITKLSQDYSRIHGAQLSAQASTGFDVNSKTAMMVRQDTVTNFTHQIQQTILNAENQRRANQYEVQSQQYALRGQAQGAQLQANGAYVNAANKAAEVQYAGAIQRYKYLDQYNQVAPTLLSNINASTY